MPFLKVGKENTSDIHIYYEDLGSGKPVVLVHGWPLDGASWERQTRALLAAGYRVITYDRRGFGRSDKPSEGYEYDTLSADLNALITALDLHDAALVGFSMGGGELARYMSKFEAGRVTKLAFLGAVTPYLKKTAANVEGVDPSVFEGIKLSIEKDRFAFLAAFFKMFYNKSLLSATHVSDEVLMHSFNVASQSSFSAMLHCVDAWLEDFRGDLATIKIPTLVLHGEKDATIPAENSGVRMTEFVKHAEFHVIADGPHCFPWTHSTETNTHLLRFLKS